MNILKRLYEIIKATVLTFIFIGCLIIDITILPYIFTGKILSVLFLLWFMEQ